MKTLKSKLVLDITPTKENPRNSEGAFLLLPDGTVLFAYSRYAGEDWHDNASCDIALIRSSDNGESWSEPEIIARASEFGVKNIMSVSSLVQNDGKFAFYFVIKENDGTSTVGRTVSSDGVKFLSERCGFNAEKGYYCFNNDRLVRLSDGNLAYPALAVKGSRAWDENFPVAETMIFISADDGKNFDPLLIKLRMAPDVKTKSGLQEPGLIEHSDGSIRVWARTDMSYQYESYSFDGMKTFSEPVPSEFTSPLAPMEMIRENDSVIYTVYNPIPLYNGREVSFATIGGRNPLIIRKSLDDGKSWGECHIIEADEDRGLCYPAMLFTDDNCMLIAYCRGNSDDICGLNRLGIRKIPLDEIK
ncbi:MAG: exo-alpha-sialidase [Ruminococcaceae bacterium]|nr:exo-alpha-sialidase [Oscillospiraceae bacterium]